MNEPGEAAVSLHPAELLFTGTLAGARALDLEDRIGSLSRGKDADFIVINPDAWPPLGQALAHTVRSDDEEMARDQTLFALLMAMREPAIVDVFVRGRQLKNTA